MMPGAFGMVNPMALQLGLQTAGSGLLPPPGLVLTASLTGMFTLQLAPRRWPQSAPICSALRRRSVRPLSPVQPPGVLPPMGWPGAGVMPPLPGSKAMALGPQVGPPPAAAWFTPLQVVALVVPEALERTALTPTSAVC